MFVHNENKHGSIRVSKVVGSSVFTGKESYFLSDSFLKFKPSDFPVPTNPLTCSTKKSDREIRNMKRKLKQKNKLEKKVTTQTNEDSELEKKSNKNIKNRKRKKKINKKIKIKK